MKRYLLASVGAVVFGLATPASAADLPRRGPAVAPIAVAPIYNWTGFYIGGHIGWGSAELEHTLSDDFFLFDAGTRFGGGRHEGFLLGGQMGFNYQIGQFVLGVEGQISWTDASRDGSISVVGLTGTNFIDHSTDVNFIATLAARLGVAFGNALFYVKGGGAFLDWSSTVAFRGPDVANGSVSFGDTEFGWMVGVGLEYGFTPNWSAKIEYNFMSFDLDQHRFNLGGFDRGIDHDLDVQVIKFGINYRFGGYAAPIAARY